MSGEATGSQEEQHQQQEDAGQDITQEQQDAAFVSGFGTERGIEVPDAVTAQNTEVEGGKDDKKGEGHGGAEAQAPAQSEKPAVDPLVAKLADDVARLVVSVRENFDKVQGKFGEHNRLIQDIVKAKTAAPGTDGAPARKLGADALTKLKGLYPELGEALADDLEKVFASQPAPQAGIAQADVDAVVNQRVADAIGKIRTESDQKLAKIELSIVHPDWQSVTAGKDFGDWFKTKPVEEQQKMLTTWNAQEVASMLTEFKGRKVASAAATASKQNRLERATQPATKPAVSPTGISDEAAFVSGFKEQRGG
jgi:hypothetical protein